MTIRLSLIIAAIFLASCNAQGIRAAKDRHVPPERAYYEYAVGYEAELSGDWEAALKHYAEAQKLDPESSYLKTQISTVYLRMGRIGEAINTVEDVIKKEPDYIPALKLLGQLYSSQKRLDDAIAMYERVLKIDPSQEDVYLFIGAA
jgi:tetratricopeptide (TPR) repeat protein